MNRNDKNKKFTPLNINNVFKGKSLDSQNKTGYRIAGMQNIGKVSSMRRVPAPKWTPSIKAESGASENRQIINQTSGWVNPAQESNEQNMFRNQTIQNKDKNQWTNKPPSNKPFFLMGQEFPSLQPDSGQDFILDSNKDNVKLKESDSPKSKLDELRNRDNSISKSTLNRIDALSISKSSKGDIAATGWAAEDEEPNFDEKIVFSDEDSLTEAHNWHSDAEEVATNKSDNARISHQSSHDQHQQHQQPQHHQHQQQQQIPMMEPGWYEQSQGSAPQAHFHHPQFQQFQMPMNMAGGNHQFMTNPAQFPHQGVMQRSGTSLSSMPGNQCPINADEQSAMFLNSVAEQRNARNMEYLIAIERARQKKLGTTCRGGYGPMGSEEQAQSDQGLGRSRHTSMTSDSVAMDCSNFPSMVEMGPPGGPPLIHGLMNKPHISPMMMSPPLPPQVQQPSTMIRFSQPPPQHQTQFFMPPQAAVSLEQITDPKLMEKWLEFLKQQAGTIGESGYEVQSVDDEQQQHIRVSSVRSGQEVERATDECHQGTRQLGPTRNIMIEDEQKERSSMVKSPSDQNQSLRDNDRFDNSHDTKTSKDLGDTVYKDGTHAAKSLYSTDEDCQKIDGSKRHNRSKHGNYKESRPSKQSGKGEYGTNFNQGYGDEYQGEDDVAYEDYHVYQQHYPPERQRDYKHVSDYRRTQQTYQYYDDSYSRDQTDYGYRSGSLKYKSTKSKEYNKPLGAQVDCSQSERGHSSTAKKSGPDSQEYQYNDPNCSERKDGKEARRGTKSDSASYSNKRYDSRSYKDRPTEPSRQEFSMGFAVNPKESRRSNYYQSSYNRRYYGSEYSYYGNYPPTNPGSNSQQYDYGDNYYQSDHYSYYDQDPGYPSTSGKSGSKRSARAGSGPMSTATDQWRSGRSDKSKSESVSTKANGRSNRNKSDKRQSSIAKDCTNDIDQEEWATASEGGSERSSSAPRDGFKSTTARHPAVTSTALDQHENNTEPNDKLGKDSTGQTQRASENRSGSNSSCNGKWPPYQDEDGNGGPSGGSGAAGSRSNLSQNKSDDSSQSQSTDHKPSTNDSSSKDGSNNNNSQKESLKSAEGSSNRIFADFIITKLSSSVINVDKLPEVTEDEELLYENVEQFQEVLSKATKKSRKIEEQKRLKEEMEQKRLESLRLKIKNDSKIIKKPIYRKEQTVLKNDKLDINVNRKIENKIINVGRDKDTLINNNNFKKYECNKEAMHIGSWDNSLADEINSERKLPPKPIGTPASTSTWNAKVKSMPKCNTNAVSNSTGLRVTEEMTKAISQSEGKNTKTSKTAYHENLENKDPNYNSTIAYTYKNTLFNRSNEDIKMKDQLDQKSTDITLSGAITFDYETKNLSGDNKQTRNTVAPERGIQKNDQQSFKDKINLVKNIWDNQSTSVPTTETENNRPVATANVDLDIHTVTTSNIQETIVSRNVDSTPTLSITNVCKVKPQLQQDFTKKDPGETFMPSSGFAIRNSPAAFLAQNQGNFMPYTHRLPQELLQDHLHASDALASLFSTNQPSMHINYNLPNSHHLVDSALLRQNPQDHLITNKMNFISQQSFYPQAAVTPKLYSNAAGQLPLNMDIGSSHAALPLQQLLLTRQNSINNMIQSNGMSIPFIQGGQQHVQAQTPLFPATPILGPSSFTNPFSQGHLPSHYSPGNFSSLHQHPQFPQNHHQMLLNQQQQQQHQQILQNQISHDRVINSGQSGLFNSILGSSDISANTGLPDFSGQTKHLNHNNIMHGINGSAIMLPHNLNILMKPHLFAKTSQYNSLQQAPIQTNYQNIRNSYEGHSNMKIGTELDMYKSSSDNNVMERNTYCIDNYMGMPKQRADFYIDQNEYDNCDMNNGNWTSGLRQTNTNNFVQTLDFQSQRSPITYPVLDPTIAYNNESGLLQTPYRFSINNSRDTYQTLPTNLHKDSSNYVAPSYRGSKQPTHFQHDHNCHVVKQACRGNYDSETEFASSGDHSFTNPVESNDTKKISKHSACNTAVNNEPVDNFTKDLVNEKSFPDKKKNSKQRSSFSDNFDEKNQSWSIAEDDSVDGIQLGSSCNIESSGSIDGVITGHSPAKQYGTAVQTAGTTVAVAPRSSNLFDQQQCQFGYHETQLSSQTAESLGKYDSTQLKNMIMKLREGPVMTFEADFPGFDGGDAVTNSNSVNSHILSRKTKLITPFQTLRNSKPLHKSYGSNIHSSDLHGSDFVGMGFYSRYRALTPPPASTTGNSNTPLRNYRTSSRGSRYNYRFSYPKTESIKSNTVANATSNSNTNDIDNTDLIETTNNSTTITNETCEDSCDGSDININNTTTDTDYCYQQQQVAAHINCDTGSLMADNIIDSAVL